MQNQKQVICPENEELVSYMLMKRQELAEKPKGIKENVDVILSKACNSVCSAKTPIKTLKDLSQIKCVGKWVLKLMQGFFDSGSGISEPEDFTKKVKRAKGAKRYVPQKNSVAYALLITLYRPEKGKGKAAQFGSSPRDWYSGWSCMKTLISKGLVVKSSCPAKYMLTEQGKEAACECLLRSRLLDEGSTNVEVLSDLDVNIVSNLESALPDSTAPVISSSAVLRTKKKSSDVPLESLERFMRMGYTKEQVLDAFAAVSETSLNKEISSLWPAVLCHLREDQVYGLHSEPQTLRKGQVDLVGNQSVRMNLTADGGNMPNLHSVCYVPHASTLKTCSSSVCPAKKLSLGDLEANLNILSMPPLSLGERFEDVYEVILILDDREQFAIQGLVFGSMLSSTWSKYWKLIESICKEHKIKIVVRRLPVGDAIWIACQKYLHCEYVLDFIVERKKVDDLRSSIRDNRYKDQKLRLLRCGLKKLIYLVEGDPNSSEAAESIKTACFTTEILEGFDVQRTSCLRDTLKKYGYLTRSITQYYGAQLLDYEPKGAGICPTFDEFIKRCQDLEKMTVSDVFAIQLMQVPQVTEEIAISVLDLYPTIISLAHAYSLLDGDTSAQEEMLRKQSNNAINAAASRNIFRLVWGQ
ncbi:crossover junction endonuclease MUS81 isoform X3 [Manihot esculenta]|uniref:crossover junction endonuclease MUS81 isoform X3 n=1 Tax=Manihot esculenta TaxID=3983 RepID=UPI001CC77E3A|nr:crossover junction endonuclease MUS81 isoform X3 [Manihot esculenta]